jgi:hypothetical protein
MWALTIIAFLILGTLAFRGARGAYLTFVTLGVLFFPAHVGSHFHPTPCDCQLSVPLALFSLTNYKHIVLFTIFFLMSSMQWRDRSLKTQLLIASVAVLAMGIYVELAEGITGQGHCRLRDLVPDLAGAVVGAALLVVVRKLRPVAVADTGQAGRDG